MARAVTITSRRHRLRRRHRALQRVLPIRMENEYEKRITNKYCE